MLLSLRGNGALGQCRNTLNPLPDETLWSKHHACWITSFFYLEFNSTNKNCLYPGQLLGNDDETSSGPRIMMLMHIPRVCINGSPVARRPLEITTGYLNFQLVARIGYWK